MAVYGYWKNTWRLLILAVLCVVVSGQTAAAKVRIEPLSAKELVNKITTDGKGKIVIVNIFAAWCAPCREEVPGLIAVRKAFPESDLLMLGISVDKPSDKNETKVPKALQAFADEMQFNYPVYVSAPGFEETVGVSAIPQLLVYDKSGQLVVNHKGFVAEDALRGVVQKLQKK